MKRTKTKPVKKRKRKWQATRYPGVRYRTDSTRRHGVGPDRYFTVRYTLDGREHEEGLGWASEGWTAERASAERNALKSAQQTGTGHCTLAEKREAARRARSAAVEEKEREARENLTLAEAWVQYLPTARSTKKPRSVAREIGLFTRWIHPAIGPRPLRDVVPLHLEKLKKRMADSGQSPRSIEYALAVIRQVYHFARDNDLYDGSIPTNRVKAPRADNRRVRFLSREEADRLLDGLALRSVDVHDMALLSLHCGLRFGEVAGLKWGDVEWDRDQLRIRDTKNSESRVAYLTGAVRSMLEQRGPGGPDELIFPGRHGERVPCVSSSFAVVVKELGLNDGVTDRRNRVVFHTLRHTFASWLVMSGTDLYTVQRLMGHKSQAMTERYSHLAPEHLKSAARAIETFGT